MKYSFVLDDGTSSDFMNEIIEAETDEEAIDLARLRLSVLTALVRVIVMRGARTVAEVARPN